MQRAAGDDPHGGDEQRGAERGQPFFIRVRVPMALPSTP
jgi:hypothetical protein